MTTSASATFAATSCAVGVQKVERVTGCRGSVCDRGQPLGKGFGLSNADFAAGERVPRQIVGKQHVVVDDVPREAPFARKGFG